MPEVRPITFVFLGDYIDRGPESAGVIGYLLDLQSRMPERVIALKGNHEAMALEVIDGTIPAHYWLAQGGAETLPQLRCPQRGGPARRACRLAAFTAAEATTTAAVSSSTPASIPKSHSMRSRTLICCGSGSRSCQTGAIMAA